ncbi:hypothetical protein BDP27DRAFT_1379941 [Rhodocollybia butyracea]|uniref:Uncharacterized protein n=1 Tax=Rhodocollybia butyracea TaxID=206335 RepID=A0A9P5Q828_9AGAR|nr:hypothetical protein BDP27DRAFT_1379941 [Rhodocollybia butyracea]
MTEVISPTAANSTAATKPTTAKSNKIPRRSSKPIINWFQRKLAGTVKTKRVDNVPQNRFRSSGPSRPTRGATRVTSSPLPSAVPAHVNRPQGRLDAMTGARRKTISLNEDDDIGDSFVSDEDEVSDEESVARGSAWSPRSVEADEDASMRPLPPSSPPSPSPSRSSSSYLSDPRTFKSIAASTKPTTLLSIDLHGNGMGHIAEAPITPSSQATRFAQHVRTSSTSTNPNPIGSGASITFSALPPSPQSSSRPSSTVTTPPGGLGSVQAPLHTTHHPRNNPRPSSPPMDNASMLTLASSAYAIPGLRVGLGTPIGWSSSPPSAIGGGADSVSQFESAYADVESQNENENDEDPLDDRDVDASLRALRPRSTRRGSWESEASRWSARIGISSLARERSVWTTNSIRTGALSTDHVDEADSPDQTSPTRTEDDSSSPPEVVNATESAPITIEDTVESSEKIPEIFVTTKKATEPIVVTKEEVLRESTCTLEATDAK